MGSTVTAQRNVLNDLNFGMDIVMMKLMTLMTTTILE
jgi:hypothetical protein